MLIRSTYPTEPVMAVKTLYSQTLERYSVLNKWESFTMGSVLSKKSKLKIKNVIPNDKDMSKVSARILFRKNPDFDVLCFDINIHGFYPARFRLWLQNHPMNPPTPDLSVEVSSSDSGYDL